VDFAYVGAERWSARPQMLRVHNDGTQDHQLILARLRPDASVSDWMRADDSSDLAPPIVGVARREPARSLTCPSSFLRATMSRTVSSPKQSLLAHTSSSECFALCASNNELTSTAAPRLVAVHPDRVLYHIRPDPRSNSFNRNRTGGDMIGRMILLALTMTLQVAAQGRPPVLDVHLHAAAADEQGPPPLGMCTPIPTFQPWDPSRPFGEAFMAMLKSPACSNPVWSPLTDEALMKQTIDVMKRLNVVGVLSGTPERVATWMAAAPERFIAGLAFHIGRDAISPDSMRALNKAGRLAVLGEVSNQYSGIAPDDPRMEPYWALAEELDIPVGIHVGTGPPGVIYLGATGYRARLHSALTMEEVLVRHPKLRVYLMHAGYPLLDDLLAVLYAHPQVHVDVGVIVYTQPRPAFYRFLQGVVDAGFLNRVMFGSDQMVWPGVIERSIDVINAAPFLTPEQKRDILYNNAARFLRLSAEEIAKHNRM
jgi:uncharacterized protein